MKIIRKRPTSPFFQLKLIYRVQYPNPSILEYMPIRNFYFLRQKKKTELKVERLFIFFPVTSFPVVSDVTLGSHSAQVLSCGEERAKNERLCQSGDSRQKFGAKNVLHSSQPDSVVVYATAYASVRGACVRQSLLMWIWV